MGNPIDIRLLNGMTVLFIRKPSDEASIRFKAQLFGEVGAITICAFSTVGRPKIRFGIQEDEGGLPKGEWISETGVVQLSSSQSFKTFNLNKGVNLTQGKVYHVVIEPGEDPLNGTAAIVTYQANYLGQPFNQEDPDITWPDTNINTLSFGTRWTMEDKWPIFIIRYRDGRSEGQPYSLAAPWVVYGSTCVGQTIIPASDYRIGKLAFDVSLKGAEPKDKLYYKIMDSANQVLADGVFAEQKQLTIRQTWIEVTLPTTVELKAGKLYRIFLTSPGTDLQTAYHLYGHEFSNNYLIGYGGLQHQLVTSHDGGIKWSENPDADSIFKLTTVK